MERTLWPFLLAFGLAVFSFSPSASSQSAVNGQLAFQAMTFEDCIQYAMQNNPNLQQVKLDEVAGEYQVKEVRASGLPQASLSGRYTDNFALPTQLLPGEIIGQPGTTVPVQFGVRHGLYAGLEVNQLLFSKSYFTGLKAAEAARGLYQANTLMAKENLVYNIAQLYLQLQITDKQKEILNANLGRVVQLIGITEAQLQEGLIKKVDVDQLRVNRTNLETEIQSLDINYGQQLSLLKYYMGMPMDTPMQIVGLEEAELEYPLSQGLNLQYNTTLRQLQKQEELTGLELQSVKDGYFPVLSAFASYNWQGQSDKLFSKENKMNTFGSGMWGLSLSIPVFDGFQKKFKAQQIEVSQRQLALQSRQVANQTQMEFHNATEQLRQSRSLISQQEKNMQLAEELYSITKLSYQEGVAPLTELLNAETSLKEAQTQYLTATLQQKLAELGHLKTSGELARLIEAGSK
ncbi:MAG: TolC family protein [Phaeodactylibacter sp.]|nr:TolC family protein [Phaeodactylibacter sp.]MCB9276844.1 TolC family protein [Lewinellaceae bacterium]